MTEFENSSGIIEQKIDQILQTINEVRDTVKAHSNEITDMKVQLALQKQTDDALREDISEVKDKNEKMKGQVIGCIISVIGTVIGAVILAVIGLG